MFQFSTNKDIKRKCDSYGIQSDMFRMASKQFSELLIQDKCDFIRLETVMRHFQGSNLNPGQVERILMPAFLRFFRQEYPDDCGTLNDLMSINDLRKPADFYPEARAMKRHIIMHVGPTNSGKTHRALERFAQSETGIYCGPLRLLAHEIYERMNAKGIDCNLLTGEERKESSNVDKWSATVEMASISKPFDVAVIDEIQMISDRDRGWAWTNAVLGSISN